MLIGTVDCRPCPLSEMHPIEILGQPYPQAELGN
jgi:hypothetical protein